MKTTLAVGALALAGAFMLATPTIAAQEMPRTESEQGASAYIISPQHGEVVGTQVKVKFGLSGMGVAPAGIDMKGTGHHHLLVDIDSMPAMDQPMGGNIIHFGGGQTETTITLEPGEHTLQLILGDKNHVPHDPAVMSEKISITVVDN